MCVCVHEPAFWPAQVEAEIKSENTCKLVIFDMVFRVCLTCSFVTGKESTSDTEA